MTALIDGRPRGLDAYYRPGKTFTFTITWPAGALAGRTFTATLDAAPVTVAVDGDTMTVKATAAQTTAAGLGDRLFVLTETTGGGTEPLVVGTWAGSDRAGQTRGAATVRLDGLVVDLAGPGLYDHATDLSLHRGGQQLAVAHMTQNIANTTTAFVDIPGGAITFVVPPSGRYAIEAGVLVRCSDTGVIAGLALTDAADNALVNDWHRSGGVNDQKFLRLGLRYPTPRNGHPAVKPGDSITYKLRLSREGAAGTAEVLVDFGGVTIAECYHEAVTR